MADRRVTSLVLIFLIMATLAFFVNVPVIVADSEGATNCAGSGSAASPHQYARNETAAGAFQCALLNWLSLTNIPSSCVANQFVQAPTATSLGCAALSSVAWSLLTGFPAGCSAGNFVTAIGATLTCAADNAAEVASNCAAGPPHQYARNETAGGVLQCALLSWASLTGIPAGCSSNQFAQTPTASSLGCAGLASVAWSLLTGFPSACSAGNHVTGVGASLTCVADNTAEVAANCAGSGSSASPHQFLQNETSAGAFQCSEIPWVSLKSYPSACSSNNFISALADSPTCSSLASVAWSLLTSFPSACSAHNYITALATTPTCSTVSWTGADISSFPSACAGGTFVSTLATSPTCTAPNVAFVSNANTCTDTTSGTAKMMGFGTTYTTQAGTGKVMVTLDWQITAPGTAALNTKWTLAYGTGSAPACNGAAAGTTVGNQYGTFSFSNAGNLIAGHETVVITGLTASTTYWFDLQAVDSTGASWIYSNPQLSVIET